jgi:endonuclease YncB( thermonuclease family)
MPGRVIAQCLPILCAAVLLATPEGAQAEPIHWRACQPFEKRVTCVVDGDTFWYRGTKIRILDIDAPEIEGQCRAERTLAQQATDGLIDLLNTGLVRIQFDGEDRYGRALAHLWTRDGPVGPALIAAGLAEPYGRRGPSPWCRR